jgi:hypothetical protein
LWGGCGSSDVRCGETWEAGSGSPRAGTLSARSIFSSEIEVEINPRQCPRIRHIAQENGRALGRHRCYSARL